jgi:UDP-glucose 4-epimerase
MAKTAVTGGCGFIGGHVVDALKDSGHDVLVIDLNRRPHREDVRSTSIDLLDLSSVIRATEGVDHLYHLAAVANVNYAFQYPVYTTALNVMGTANVLEAARLNGIRRVYLASTVWVYNGAPNQTTVDETVPFYLHGAGHVYTSTKMSAEMLCHNFSELFGVDFTILRYGIPYGPRMREEMLIPIFLQKALRGEPLTVAGKGDQFRCFLYASDLARAHVLAMDDKARNQTYNLEGSEPVSVLAVAEGIKRLVGPQVTIEFVPARPGDFAGKSISAVKAGAELGWTPTVRFEDGLRMTVDWFRSMWDSTSFPSHAAASRAAE